MSGFSDERRFFRDEQMNFLNVTYCSHLLNKCYKFAKDELIY